MCCTLSHLFVRRRLLHLPSSVRLSAFGWVLIKSCKSLSSIVHERHPCCQNRVITELWAVPDSRQTLLISLLCCPLEGHYWDRLTPHWTCQYKSIGETGCNGQELSTAFCSSPLQAPAPSVKTAAFCPLPLPSDWSLAGSYMQANYKRHHPNNVAVPLLGCFLFSPNWPESQITHFPTLHSGTWSLSIILKVAFPVVCSIFSNLNGHAEHI